MPKSITFGSHVFTSTQECSAHSRERVFKYKAGETLNTDDFEYFIQLFTLHPDYQKKRGVGIKAIKYDLDGISMKNCCLWLVRHDGSTEDISWRKCIRPHTHNEEVEIAFKRAVTGSNDTVDNAASCDAGVNFDRMLSQFLNNKRIKRQSISVAQSNEASDPRPLLVDHWLAAEWYAFHKANTKLLA